MDIFIITIFVKMNTYTIHHDKERNYCAQCIFIEKEYDFGKNQSLN